MTIKSHSSVVFLDSTVPDTQTLLLGLNPETELVTLHSNRDGIKVITEYLSNNPNIKSLHIVSHGSPGCVYLGNAILSLDNINNYTKYLAKWSVKEILLYGCNVAVGDAGEEFITKLHAITKASIAASKTLTGNENLGGDWNIDITLGQITSDLAFDEAARKAYAGVLATYTVNTLQDEDNGVNVGGVSLRDAITAANATPVADTILFNSALNGAIITLTQGQLQITDDLTIRGNSATPVGISGNNNNRVFSVADGTNDLINVTFDGLKIINGNGSGGGIYNRENTTVTNSIISGNRGSYGGGIYNDGNGQLTVNNSTISGNSASAKGGGIYSDNSAITTVINSTIAGNTANNGGGFFNNGSDTYTSTIINSTISGNSANYNGGIANVANLTVINSTLSSNVANIRNGGLGNSRILNIFNSTITQNSAPQDQAAGIYTYGGNSAVITQLANTIVSGNFGTDVDYLDGSTNTFISIGNNLIGDGNGVGNFIQPGDQTNIANPRLGGLTNNGGPTLTHLPLSTSPAINGGNNISIALDSLDLDGDGNRNEQIAFDQTGDIRIQGGTVDIGAVETNSGGAAPPLLSIKDVTVTEGNSGTTNANFILTLSKSSNKQITVKYSTTNGTGATGAVSPTDFTGATNKTLTINPGSTSGTINIPVKGDTNIEANETFSVKLLEASNATLNDATGVGTIVNNDFSTISLDKDLTVTEGNSGQKFVNFPLKLSRPSAIPVKVTVKTANGSASAGTDFNALNQVVTFAANKTTATARVAVRGDKTFEPNESFFVKLSNPVNGIIGKAQVKGTITNDDAKPKISISNVTVSEGDSGTKNAIFQVKLTNPSYQTISADFITVNGSAKAPSDYNAKSGVVSFSPGQTTKPVSIQVRGDRTFEGNETFSVKLSDLKNVTAGDLLGVGTIRNNDAQAKALVGDAESFTLGESTPLVSSKVAFNDSISLGGSSPTEKIAISGITQPDLFAADSNWNSASIGV